MSLVKGHHHVSMFTKDARMNKQFYTEVLGLRLVKKTVNQDNPSMYHLFYGDTTGSVGTELSFFELPRAGHTTKGSNSISRIGLRVPSIESLTFWQSRFNSKNVIHDSITTYAGYPALPFEDPEGLELVLLVDENTTIPSSWHYWQHSPIAEKHSIMGIHIIETQVKRAERFGKMLTEVFEYEEKMSDEEGILYKNKAHGGSNIIVKKNEGSVQKPGKGSIHHFALAVESKEELVLIEQRVQQRGYHSSGIVNRYYFESLYFRELNGILIEVATMGPGFLIDSKEEQLGEKLDLPPFLEERRAEIEAGLSPLN